MSSWIKRALTVLANANVVHKTETIDQLTARIDKLTQAQWEDIFQLSEDAAQSSCSFLLLDNDSEDGFNLLEEKYDQTSATNLLLIVTKKAEQKSIRFFYSSSIPASALNEPRRFELSQSIFIGDLEEDIRAVGGVICNWDQEPLALTDQNDIRPTMLVNDASGKSLVPLAIWPWMPEMGYENEHLRLFGNASSYSLALSLPSSLHINSTGLLVAVADFKRKSRGEVEDAYCVEWADPIVSNLFQSAARWIYCEGPGTESRHAILSSEISRSYPKGKHWREGLSLSLENALETAKIAYRLHLYDKSIDAIKVMSDLRKGLAEDVRSVSNQTATLSGSLWRDAAIAIGAVALKSVSSSVGTVAIIGAASYLAASYYFNSRVAASAVQSVSENENTFRRKLYSSILPNQEYDEIAGKRYNVIINEFYSFLGAIRNIYIISVFVLLIYALFPYHQQIFDGWSCANNSAAQYFGRLFMPDAVNFNILKCFH